MPEIQLKPAQNTNPSTAARAIAIVASIATGVIALVMVTGLMVALALPAIQSYREAQRRAEARKNLDNIRQAVVNFRDSEGAEDLADE